MQKREYYNYAKVDFDFGHVYFVCWLSYCQVGKNKRRVLINIITALGRTHELQFARRHTISFANMYAWVVDFGVINAMNTHLLCITRLQHIMYYVLCLQLKTVVRQSPPKSCPPLCLSSSAYGCF